MSHSLNVTSILIVCYIPIFNGNFRTFYVNQEFEKKVLCESFIDQPSRLGDIFDWDAVSQILWIIAIFFVILIWNKMRKDAKN